jgi:hypothetical protein
LDFTSALPTASCGIFAAPPVGSSLCIVCCLLAVSGAVGAVSPVVSGALIWSVLSTGAIFSGGAFCCAAGTLGVSSVFTACAETAQAPSSNIAAVVDISRKVLMEVSCRHSAICLIVGMCGDTTSA